jgi:cytochrome c-type biogenesis protein CcmH
MMHRLLALAVALALCAALGASPASAARSKVGFTQMEQDFMCVACHEALNVAQSPEAFSERAYLRQLIAQGLDRRQIDNQFVAQYGQAVLAKPPASGFNLLIYILPPAILIIGLGTLAVTLPKWRRRSRLAAAQPMAAPARLDPEDARRLDAELVRRA